MPRRRNIFRCFLVLAGAVAIVGTGNMACAGQDPDKPFEQKLDGTSVSFKMVPIPGGSFMMGSASGKAEEQPQHEIKVEPFFMEEHEVTWDEYNLFLNNYS
ncbi:MAG TPA: SUMF1/EgtB/PvdO family nonheme iron enzyme, partial [Tepidisphaeraceae bacterium]|nr:SUMF1/EgtB/PvdO family nonheme iron enzyme [Tepidisphaeraceae bacterium]